MPAADRPAAGAAADVAVVLMVDGIAALAGGEVGPLFIHWGGGAARRANETKGAADLLRTADEGESVLSYGVDRPNSRY